MNILVTEIASDAGCAHLLYHAWYMDDGVVPISCIVHDTWMMGLWPSLVSCLVHG